MTEPIVEWVEGAMATPWVLLALFALAAIDAFFPAVPSESLVITAGVFAAASGEPSLPLVILTAAVGAFVGDHVGYLIGATASRRVAERVHPGTKRAAAFDWAGRTLAARGGPLIIVCRYIPGARTAVTLTAGMVAFPLRTFSAYDAVAAVTWAVSSALIGYIGGHAFEDNPLKGLAVGLGLALVLAGAIELLRHLAGRRRRGTRPARG